MCVIHITQHLACGHEARDVDGMVYSRCDAVSAALIFYHDQPHWQPLEQPLTLPETCAAVYPPQDGVLQLDVLADQAYWDRWMRDQFELNEFGVLQREQMRITALGPLQKSTPDMRIPYPANQVRQYQALVRYQARANKAPNVKFTVVPWACRRCIPPPAAAQQMRAAQRDHRP